VPWRSTANGSPLMKTQGRDAEADVRCPSACRTSENSNSTHFVNKAKKRRKDRSCDAPALLREVRPCLQWYLRRYPHCVE
jgi:hypothetical protein